MNLRSVTDGMLYRPLDGWADLDVRVKRGADGEPEGVVEGIAVPWDKPTRIHEGLVEEFARGAFDAQIKRPQSVFLARDHMPRGGALIGRLTELRNDAAGLYVSGRVSKTPIGLETLTLLSDGVLDSFSIGFVEGKNTLRTIGRDEITRRETAGLREVAIVPHPAYAGAKITGVRGTCPACGDGGADEDAEPAARAADIRSLILTIPTLPPVPRRAGR